MNSIFSIIRLVGLVLVASLCGLARADVTTVTQAAELLIQEGQPAAALELLQPAAQEYAGKAKFDYVLALALMDSGDHGQAEFVFERLLTMSPGFHGARLDYARVLVARKKYSEALEQLDTLGDSRPPERALNQISNLKNIINQRANTSRWSRYLEASTAAGYDSNVNSATVVDEFLGFALDATSQEQDSDFLDFSVAGGVGYQLSRGMKLSGRLQYRKRENAQASFVDSDALSLETRLVRVSETDYQQLTLTGYQFDIDGSRNSEGIALSGTWLRKIAPQWRIGVTAEAGRIDFGDNLEVKDVDRYKAGLLGVYSVGENGQGQLLLRAGAGTDEPRLSSSRYARDFIYAGSSFSWKFNPAIRAAINLNYQNSQFKEVFFEQLYSDKREDDRYRLTGSVDWKFRPRWVLTHSLAYTRNDTFVDIFEYERFEALLRLRYKFQ